MTPNRDRPVDRYVREDPPTEPLAAIWQNWGIILVRVAGK
jgi:hypothetical protein